MTPTPEQDPTTAHVKQMIGDFVVRIAVLLARIDALEAELQKVKGPPDAHV